MREFLIDLLGRDNVIDTPEGLAPYREDFTESEPGEPQLAAFATETVQVQRILAEATARRMSVTPRVYGTNIGSLAVPKAGGLVLDLTRMDRIVEVNQPDMYAVIEPGVTQAMLKERLRELGATLTLGYSLAPPRTSVFANALLGGLTNRSLKYGDQSQSISGLEVVLADGRLVKTGAWALAGATPFGLVPFPDLSGLFVGWAGTTGVAVRMAFQLWPAHPENLRLFVLCYTAAATFEAARRLCRTELFDDLGGLSWPSGRMLLGVQRPHLEPAAGEPVFFLYVDITAESAAELAVKRATLERTLAGLRAEGHRYEDPLDIATLVKVDPAMATFAEFPTELTFLTGHPGGGLTWIGTYGPLSRFEEAAEAGSAIMVRHGYPPLLVSRPMRGGHFGVLRFIAVFDKQDQSEVERVRAMNRELLAEVTRRGFVMYKTPAWAWRLLAPAIDPGMLDLMAGVKRQLDPAGILNPGQFGLPAG